MLTLFCNLYLPVLSHFIYFSGKKKSMMLPPSVNDKVYPIWWEFYCCLRLPWHYLKDLFLLPHHYLLFVLKICILLSYLDEY